MLTPVDIQQKKFHIGLGYDKKDVNIFFAAVAQNYEALYRSNAELIEQVGTLTDSLQHYRNKESNLEKTLMLAEKDSEDTKSKATKEAKSIELDAKNKARHILEDAENRLEELKEQITVLETQYAAYKSNFSTLIKKQFEQLKEDDFDVDAYIDEKALSLLGGHTAQATSGDSFGAYTGDPQMRDMSTLGAGGDVTSTSAIYTSTLSANENFVDPFNPKDVDGQYNPFDGRVATKAEAKTNNLKVSSPDKTKVKRAPSAKQKEASSYTSNTKTSSSSTESKIDTIPTVNTGV